MAASAACAAATTSDRESSLMPTPDLQQRILDVHRSFPSGVAVVTTAVGGQPYGLLVSAFSSVSMEPPLVLVCVKTTARTHEHLYRGNYLGINLLAHDQIDVARRFAASGGDKFADVAWHPGHEGVPLLDGVSAHLQVKIDQRIPAGTHTIFIGRVIAAHASDRPPLVYFNSAFFDGAQLTSV
jgi:flavin reductase (DIM6/NTAB) family NADH-FMN oxidoreductase RutF